MDSLFDCPSDGTKMFTESQSRVLRTTRDVFFEPCLRAKTGSAAHLVRLFALGRADRLSRCDDGRQAILVQENDTVGVCHNEIGAREHEGSDTGPR